MHDVILTRRVGLPVADAWHAWTDQVAFAEWFWPARLRPEYDIDAHLGGSWRVSSPVAAMAVGGRYTTVSAPEILVFTWRWEGETQESTVTVRFAPARDRSTLVEVTHTGIESPEAAADLLQGWTDCLGRLPGGLDKPAG
jgi:uncharacterized protein YndB with AHSA1/START domain